MSDVLIGAALLGNEGSLMQVSIPLAMVNRHGLVAGATGTGKTITLKVLAESLSSQGVSVFAADVKGDLSGLALAGSASPKITERLKQIGIDSFEQRAFPCVFWDLYGKNGHPLRSTISEVGPLLLCQILDLNEVQAGVLQVLFKYADDQGLLLLDLKDLRALLAWAADNQKEISVEYGKVSTQSIAAIQRSLLVLEQEGGFNFFGEPGFKISELFRKDFSGNGVVNILDATRLVNSPRLYCSFLLWLLSELFEEMPEVGDLEKPKLVFFFDEAHLLFDNAPRELLEKVEQIVRLIRSKGVGVFFVTQQPRDIPETVLAQLGTRIQHALRAYTPKEQESIKATAKAFRANPAFESETVLAELGIGEALVSTLDAEGRPSMVEKTLVAPPRSSFGGLSDTQRVEILKNSPLSGVYDQAIDRESAYELLKQRNAAADQVAKGKVASGPPSAPRSNRQSASEAFVKSMLRSVGSYVGRELIRGVMGSLTRRR